MIICSDPDPGVFVVLVMCHIAKEILAKEAEPTRIAEPDTEIRLALVSPDTT